MRNKTEQSKTQNFILGEHPGNFHEKIPPTTTFYRFNRFSLSAYRSIQLDKRKKWEHEKGLKFHSGGATGEFSLKNTPHNLITF